MLRGVSAGHLRQSLRGRRFRDPERHGKWLIARTDGLALLMHFGMTGGLQWAGNSQERHRYDRVVFAAALTDQSVIAGLGNLLADEILWRARIHPRTPVRQLGPAERARIHGQMRRVPRAAIPAGQVPARAGWLTGSRDAGGAPCPRCGTALTRDRMAGRETAWCPHCQPVPS